MDKKLVLFDFDGTLVNTRAATKEGMRRYLEVRGIESDFELFLNNYHRHDEVDYGWGIPVPQQHDFMEEMFVWVNEHIVSDPDMMPPLYEGMQELLERLNDSKTNMAIVTSRNEAPVLSILEHYSMGKLFKAIRTLDDLKKRGHRTKPHPDKLLCVMNELKFDAGDTIMVGDTTMDIEAGLAAMTKTLGVSWGYHERTLLEKAGAHKIVDKGEEAHPAIIQLLR